jgi:hypothetical protein
MSEAGGPAALSLVACLWSSGEGGSRPARGTRLGGGSEVANGGVAVEELASLWATDAVRLQAQRIGLAILASRVGRREEDMSTRRREGRRAGSEFS